MIHPIRTLAIVGAGLLLGACASAPTHFHTLVPPAATPAANAAAPYLIDVSSVGVPAQVDQPQLIVRRGDGGMVLLEGEQWIAPLGEEVRSALADALSTDLSTQDVHGLPRDDSKPVYRVKVDLRRFDSVPGQYALIEAAWSVRQSSGKAVLACSSRVQEAVGPGYDALVQGHQQALKTLADRIATVVRGFSGAGRADCPMGG